MLPSTVTSTLIVNINLKDLQTCSYATVSEAL
jgi:hypothetical protein